MNRPPFAPHARRRRARRPFAPPRSPQQPAREAPARSAHLRGRDRPPDARRRAHRRGCVALEHVRERRRRLDFDVDAPSFAFIAREFGSTREIVKNAPYQAEAVNEVVQTLSDGNRIVRRSSTLVARDGYGRTRQERKGGTVYVFDPIDNKSYALNPERKTAVRIPRAPSMFAPPAPRAADAFGRRAAADPADPARRGRDASAAGDGAAGARARRRQAQRRRQGRRGRARRGGARRPRRPSFTDMPPMPSLALPLLPRGKGETHARHARVRGRQGRRDDDQPHDPRRRDRQREADRDHERALVLARAARRRLREDTATRAAATRSTGSPT